MGDCPGGQQRQRRRVELLHPRPGPFPCLPLGGGRHGGRQRRQGTHGLALGLWNGQDPILKERLFGLTNSEGNHGEDVKEYYFYSTTCLPTRGSLAVQVPADGFPVQRPSCHKRGRGFGDPEYELLDTGIFDDGRYFDVQVDYAKAGPTDLWPASRSEPRSRRSADPPAPHAVVPEHLVAGAPAGKPSLRAVDGPRRVWKPDTNKWASTGCTSATT